MNIKKLQVGNVLEIYNIQFHPDELSIGYIHYNWNQKSDEKIIGIEEKKIGRWNERIFILNSGLRVLISKRKLLDIPPDIEAFLFVSKEKNIWRLHPIIKEHQGSCKNVASRKKLLSKIFNTWDESIHFKKEIVDPDKNISQPGLRPPQLGALYAIGSHWCIEKSPATVIMPTGTGKTETMLAAMVSFMRGRVLIIVPTVALREQTVKKFSNLGLLRKIKVLEPDTKNPIVGELIKRPKLKSDLKFMKNCNVVVTNISNIAQGRAKDLTDEIALIFGGCPFFRWNSEGHFII